MQTTLDAMALLSHANHEVSIKRKRYVRSVIKNEDYKSLCDTTQITTQLFGDNISQDMKDIDLRRKLEQDKGQAVFISRLITIEVTATILAIVFYIIARRGEGTTIVAHGGDRTQEAEGNNSSTTYGRY